MDLGPDEIEYHGPEWDRRGNLWRMRSIERRLLDALADYHRTPDQLNLLRAAQRRSVERLQELARVIVRAIQLCQLDLNGDDEEDPSQ